jgi:hypothetical protein
MGVGVETSAWRPLLTENGKMAQFFCGMGPGAADCAIWSDDEYRLCPLFLPPSPVPR